jgi:hypothetical protein
MIVRGKRRGSRKRRAFGTLALIVAAILLFCLGGGLYWLQKYVFPPRRPRFMPANSVWIDAPPLPISWHHGWWFGCDISSSGLADYCRFVTADENEVYADEYLPCRSHVAIQEANAHLKPPRDSFDLWLFEWQSDGVIGFLSDGDLLLPTSLQNQCADVERRLEIKHR